MSVPDSVTSTGLAVSLDIMMIARFQPGLAEWPESSRS